MGGSSGSGKTSTGTSSSFSPFANILAKFGKSALPIYRELNSQIGQAIKTGGVNSGIPLINRSVDAARATSSQGMMDTQQALARAGLGNTSFAQDILSRQRQGAADTIGNIGPSVASEFIGMAPGQTGQGVGALGTAASINRSGTTTETPSFWDFFTQGFQSGGNLGMFATGH